MHTTGLRSISSIWGTSSARRATRATRVSSPARSSPATAPSHGETPHQLGDVDVVERHEAVPPPVRQVGPGAADAEGEQRHPLRSGDEPDQQLGARRCHQLDEHPVQPAAERRGELPDRGADRVVTGDPEPDGPGPGLVQHAARHRLQRHRSARLPRRRHHRIRGARHAEALVVGHRGHGAVASAFLGSTSLGCILHAPCPVTVVPVTAPLPSDSRIAR